MQNNLPSISTQQFLIEELSKEAKQYINSVAIPHQQLLETFIDLVEVVDFVSVVYPEVLELKQKLNTNEATSAEAEKIRDEISKFKLNSKEILVLSVEQILKLANQNNWGLCKNNNSIFLYNGEFWYEIESDELKSFLGKSASKMGIQDLTAKHYHFREELLKQFLSAAYLLEKTVKLTT